MLKGTYVFKQGGQEIGRSENLITINGKTTILQYLTGSIGDWASTIAIGAIGSPVLPSTSTSPAATDLALAYEIARSAVTMKSFKAGSPNLIVVKGTVDPLVTGNIYEVGLFNSNTYKMFGKRDELIITDFSSINDWTVLSGSKTNIPFAAQSPVSPRVGLYSVDLSPNSSISNNNYLLDMSSYSELDTLDLLVNIASGKSGTLAVTLTDINNQSVEIDYVFTSSVTGYQILSQALPSSIKSLSNIQTIKLQTVGSSSEIVVDALRISVLNEFSNSTGLVSRSVLTTPIATLYGVPLDIEYYLQLS